MSFRGRGRGRGWGGGGGFRPCKQASWELFPEIVDLGTAAGVVENIKLAKHYVQLQRYWKSSPYYYEGDDASKKAQSVGLKRFSDKMSEITNPKPPLSHFIRMEAEYVPAELARGQRKEKHGTKRVRWNPESDMGKLDLFEKLEKKYEGQDGDEKKEGEGEGEEEEEERVEDEEEDLSDDDYNKNIDFDDDEDDFNMADDGDDEPIF